MAFAAGVYTLPAGNPVVTNTTIDSSWANTTLADIATALSTCVLKDGTQTLTANIPMGGFKLTGLAAGTSANDSVRFAQLQAAAYAYLTGTAGTNTITASGTPTVTALSAGMVFRFIPANTNTGATTLQADSTAATNVFWNGAALIGGELRQNVPVEVIYDGTQYQIIGSAAMANVAAIPANVMRIQGEDRTKQFTVSVTGVAAGATVTMVVPGTGGATFVGDTLAQTLTNKTLTSPTLQSPVLVSGVLTGILSGGGLASRTDMESASSTSQVVTPSVVKYSPNVIKTACNFGVGGIATGVLNVTSVTDTGSGDWTVNFTQNLNTGFYTTVASLGADSVAPATGRFIYIANRNLGSLRVVTADNGGNISENATQIMYVMVMGQHS